MKKSSVARGVGFIAALGASAALVAAAVSTTGAYFTDSHDGSINAGTGHVRVDTTDPNLNFENLLPGDYKTQRINYTARGTSAEDIWLVFPSDGSAQAIVGNPGVNGGGLGRYGHFKLTSTGGAHFVSNNLNNPASGDTNSQVCPQDTNGWGGSSAEAASKVNSPLLPFCAPSNAILLQSNLTDGQAGYADIEFGYTKIMTGGQDAPKQQVAAFKIVATQHGIRPDDGNNPH